LELGLAPSLIRLLCLLVLRSFDVISSPFDCLSGRSHESLGFLPGKPLPSGHLVKVLRTRCPVIVHSRGAACLHSERRKTCRLMGEDVLGSVAVRSTRSDTTLDLISSGGFSGHLFVSDVAFSRTPIYL